MFRSVSKRPATVCRRVEWSGAVRSIAPPSFRDSVLLPSSMNHQSAAHFSGYSIEAAELIQAVREGHLPGIPAEEIRKCDICSRIYHETLEGRTLEDLPPVCAVREGWVKLWMANHDSLHVFHEHSLDKSANDDDSQVQKVGQEAIVVAEKVGDVQYTQCGLYCCSDEFNPLTQPSTETDPSKDPHQSP